MLLKDKVAIITGSTRGIGNAIAKEFLKNGAIVVVCGSRESSVQKAVEALRTEFPESKIDGRWPDLSKYEDLEDLTKSIKEKFGRLDIMVNNAGISDDISTFDKDPVEFAKLIDLNINSVFYGCKAASIVMKEQGEGCIINTSSMVSKNGQTTGVSYPTSKFGVNGLTISLARELGQYGIRVNAVAPGIINTDLMQAVPKEVIEPLIDAIPLKRIGQPSDIGKGCVFLASDLASYVTGEILHVDGAMTV
ncbi:SDR family NAD(P)-dependent oxidoreductase [Helcococcus sueciensis]|uniref:SDR family NAD(P)-dependent oxidoreductase n=1 Tax=Helcococcus sueciensis TaxID=241555 RepID=UPI000400FB2B|nr:SDR family NAD(P)-dependent oxidoreductase [Helcococcus sueciensis]